MSGQYGRRKAPIVIVPTEDVLSVELLLVEDWNLLRLIPKIDKVENVLPWLACRGLINNHVECGRCKHPCSFVKFRESKDQKQWKCHDCGWSKSVRDGSFFSASQFSFETIIMIMYLLLSEMPIQSICSEMNITPVLAIKWQKKIQTVYTDVLNKLGSSGENMGIRKKTEHSWLEENCQKKGRCFSCLLKCIREQYPCNTVTCDSLLPKVSTVTKDSQMKNKMKLLSLKDPWRECKNVSHSQIQS